MSDTLCPVFCTAKLSIELVNKFFKEANKGTEDHCYEIPVGYLVASAIIPEVIEEAATTCPVAEDTLKHNPVLGKTIAEVVDWAQEHFSPESGLLSDQMVVLDDRAAWDETCLLLSLKERSHIEFAKRSRISGPAEAPDAWIAVRSDFESSIVTIMTKATGVGGDEHFESSNRQGHDGILRIREKDADEG